ncbi:hypothetical protein ACFLS1_02105 [Verrucomicrobiota bacterium]
MNTDKHRWNRVVLVGICALMMLAGCATSPQWKGTPFYSENEKEMKDPERIPLWPVVYKNKDRVSMLWPLMEKTDDHFAFRPMMSVYGLSKEEKVYNVLWPIAQFDQRSGDNRIFPAFWGDDYKTIFPLYWHGGEPLGARGGYDKLIPLWSFQKDPSGYSAYILGPFIHFQNRDGEKGWHVFPLAGSYSKYGFLLWPLGHKWSSISGTDTGNAFLPLYIYQRDKQGFRFFSLPYSTGSGVNGTEWHFVLPLFYHSEGRDDRLLLTPLYCRGGDLSGDKKWSLLLPVYFSRKAKDSSLFATLLGGHYKNKDTSAWAAFPVLSGGMKSDDRKELWMLGPLAHFGQNKDTKTSHVLPFYFNWKSDSGSVFISLPWSSGKTDNGMSWKFMPPVFFNYGDQKGSCSITPVYSRGRGATDDDKWSLLVPFYFSKKSEDSLLFATLLGGRMKDEDGSAWMILPLLSGGRKSSDKSDLWMGGPLAHFGQDDNSKTSHVFPFYYRAKDEKGSLFLSLPWSSGSSEQGKSWQFSPIMFYRVKDSDGSSMITPLYSAGQSDKGKTRWHSVIPFYYRRQAEDSSLFASLIGGWETDSDGRKWLLYPLLSWGGRNETGGEFWTLAPIFHAKWGKDYVSHHLLPAYYWNGETRTLVSPVVARWKDKNDVTTTMIPPALSWLSSGEKRSDLWVGGSLAHWSWGEEAGARHILPLMYHNKKSGTLVTPLAAKWRTANDKQVTMIPPLLSWLSSSDNRKDLWCVGPLAHFSCGEKAGSQHVFPFWYRNRQTGSFVSLAGAKWQGKNNTSTYVFPPALSWLTKGKERNDLWLAGPLAHFSWGEKPGSQHVIPLYYKDKNTFLSPVYASWKEWNTTYKMLIPLLSWYSTNGETKKIKALLGIFGEEWGRGEREGYLFPVYYYRGKKEFYTPLFGWNRNKRSGFVYPLTPLVGVRTGDYAGGWLFPVFSHKRTKKTGHYNGHFLWGHYWKRDNYSGSGMFPFYGYKSRGSIESAEKKSSRYARYGKRFWSLPACWYRNELVVNPVRRTGSSKTDRASTGTYIKRHGFFPLWSYSSTRVPEESKHDTKSRILLLLYDYKHEINSSGDNKKKVDDYTRSRVLWRLWDYERRNDDVSVDIFPAITYDRKSDKFKKVSFLWRFFRYERDKSGKKLDVLFLPVLRTKRTSYGID